MAAMITRALKAASKPVTLTQRQIAEVLKAYADRAAVSPWVTQAMAEAISTGIVKGRTVTTLVPQGTATGPKPWSCSSGCSTRPAFTNL